MVINAEEPPRLEQNFQRFTGSFRWRFAYTCILEETVRRNRRNWDWNHMKEHRDLCRSYATAYQTKLTTKKSAKEIEDHLTHCERKLDIFNLVIIRQQIEMEVSVSVDEARCSSVS